jgi:cyclopropane fatty-acyl-phospholipid synthase-like methyltransferase
MKKYNLTDLKPDEAFERHIFHRDQFAHYLRWSHILKNAKISETIVDFGCGNGNLLEVFYRNRFKQKRYIGLDIRDCIKEPLRKIEWADFYVVDLVGEEIGFFSDFNADKVCSFEVLEHVGKQNLNKFLQNFKACGSKNATYYLSTPNYDKNVGAAGNHTYDSGDGRGKSVQEFTHKEISEGIIDNGFVIVKKYGTFASIKDYKHILNGWQQEMFYCLQEYYDTNVLSVIMAPFFPEQSRNTLWILKRGINELF